VPPTVKRRRYAKRMQPSERREGLLDAARTVVLERGDFLISMEAVAEAAGVTKPVVYDFFANRDELVSALLDREIESAVDTLVAVVPDLSSVADVDPDELLVDRTVALVEAVHAHADTWRLVLMPAAAGLEKVRARSEQAREGARQGLMVLLAWGVEKRGGPKDLDLELVSQIMLATGERLAHLTLTEPETYTPERVATAARSILAALPRA
jgi:AcrR family transcriptional regulator